MFLLGGSVLAGLIRRQRLNDNHSLNTAHFIGISRLLTEAKGLYYLEFRWLQKKNASGAREKSHILIFFFLTRQFGPEGSRQDLALRLLRKRYA
jgi:hypothetical protein